MTTWGDEECPKGNGRTHSFILKNITIKGVKYEQWQCTYCRKPLSKPKQIGKHRKP